MTDSEDRLWYAVQVKPRHEKSVASLLRGRGIEQFLPLYRRERQWSDRRRVVEFPLFSQYMFCRLGRAEQALVPQVPGVRSIVGSNGRAVPVDEREIDMVRTLVESRLPLAPRRVWALGERVRVDRGPLAGCEGFLDRFNNGHRMVVTLSLLQRSVAVEIEMAWVTPIGEPHIGRRVGGRPMAWTPQRLRRVVV